MATSEITSRARRVKNRWFMRITKVLSTYQMDILYKSTKAHVGPFSSSPRTKSVKVPWGPPVSCEYQSRAANGANYNVFLFRNNNNETAGFDESLFDNLEVDIDGGEVSPFAQRVTSMYVADKKCLLAIYLSLMQHNNEFVHHNAATHDVNGFVLDGSGITTEDLVAAGGSLSDLQEFTRIAKVSAKCVDDVSQAYLSMHNMSVDPKRQLEENLFSDSSAKKRKVESIDIKEADELKDPKGLECQWKKSYVGRASIPLDSIEIPRNSFNINNERVRKISESMKVRYDPALTTIVVCPVDFNQGFDLQNIGNTKFSVVQKVHTLSAFKLLDEAGDFEKLYGHHNRQVMACVVSTNSLALNVYGNVRCKIIESNFIQAPRPQDLLHIFNALRKSEDINCHEIVSRLAKHCRFGPNETTSILKLCKKSELFQLSLIETLEKYELYETVDGKYAKNHAVAFKRGDKLKMPNNMFNNLAKIDESYFLDNFTQVITGNISLKELIDEGLKGIAVKKVAATLCQLTGYTNINDLNRRYENRFDGAALEHFLGAEQCKGQLNGQAKSLKKYYDDVVGNKVSSRFSVEVMEGSFNDFKATNLCENFDTIVAHFKKEYPEWCLDLMKSVTFSGKAHHAAVILLPNEDLQFKVLSFLRSRKDIVACGVKVFPIVFMNRADARPSRDGFTENVNYGVLFGRFTILKPPIYSSYQCIKNICDIVKSISPPASNIVLIVDEDMQLTKLNKQSEPYNVTYCGSKKSLSKFRHELADSNNCDIPSNDGSSSSAGDAVVSSEPSDSIVNSSVDSASEEARLVISKETSVIKNKVDESTTSPIKASGSSQFNDSGLGLSQSFSQSIFTEDNGYVASTQKEAQGDPYKFVD